MGTIGTSKSSYLRKNHAGAPFAAGDARRFFVQDGFQVQYYDSDARTKRNGRFDLRNIVTLRPTADPSVTDGVELVISVNGDGVATKTITVSFDDAKEEAPMEAEAPTDGAARAEETPEGGGSAVASAVVAALSSEVSEALIWSTLIDLGHERSHPAVRCSSANESPENPAMIAEAFAPFERRTLRAMSVPLVSPPKFSSRTSRSNSPSAVDTLYWSILFTVFSLRLRK